MKAGSDGQIRKTTAQWAADTKTYLEGMRLMDTDTGIVRVSSGGTYAQAWQSQSSVIGISYTYSSNTSSSGITSGTFRLDNADFSSATKLYVHDTDGLNYNQDGYWDLFTSGVITLHRQSPEGYVTFRVTRMVDQGTYHEFDVVRVGGATGLTNADEIRMAVTMDAPGVREWHGLISQSGTDAPTVIVITNSLDGEITWAYESSGQYSGTLTGAFKSHKIVAYAGENNFGSPGDPIQTRPTIQLLSEDTIAISSIDGDSCIFDMPLSIRVKQ